MRNYFAKIFMHALSQIPLSLKIRHKKRRLGTYPSAPFVLSPARFYFDMQLKRVSVNIFIVVR